MTRTAEAGRRHLAALDAARRFLLEAAPGRKGSRREALVEWAIANPIFTVRRAAKALDMSPQGVSRHVAALEAAGVVEEITGGARFKVYRTARVLDV